MVYITLSKSLLCHDKEWWYPYPLHFRTLLLLPYANWNSTAL